MPNWCDCDLSVRLPYEEANKEKANKEKANKDEANKEEANTEKANTEKVNKEKVNKDEGIKELKRFQEFAKTENSILDADKFIPYPREFKELDKKSCRICGKTQDSSSKNKKRHATIHQGWVQFRWI